MTDKMSKDLIKQMSKKIKGLTAAVVILAILLVCVTAFAFSDFELIIETGDDYEIQQDGDTSGENSVVEQQASVNDGNPIPTICGTVILCVLIITIGAVICAYSRKKAQDSANNTDGRERLDEQKQR